LPVLPHFFEADRQDVIAHIVIVAIGVIVIINAGYLFQHRSIAIEDNEIYLWQYH